MDLFYTILTFLGGLIGGVFLTAYKYRDYIKIGLTELINAYEDGKLDLLDLVSLLIRVNAHLKKIDDQKSALEIIQFIKQRFNLQ